jgi:hypothetical protein
MAISRKVIGGRRRKSFARELRQGLGNQRHTDLVKADIRIVFIDQLPDGADDRVLIAASLSSTRVIEVVLWSSAIRLCLNRSTPETKATNFSMGQLPDRSTALLIPANPMTR